MKSAVKLPILYELTWSRIDRSAILIVYRLMRPSQERHVRPNVRIGLMDVLQNMLNIHRTAVRVNVYRFGALGYLVSARYSIVINGVRRLISVIVLLQNVQIVLLILRRSRIEISRSWIVMILIERHV